MTATFTLADLADRLGAQVRGDGSVRIRGVAPLERAQAGEIAALVDRKYLRLLDRSSPSALIIAPDLAELIKQPCLVSNNAYATFARALALFHPPPAVKPGIDATARIDPTAKVSARAQIGAHVSVGARVIIDEGCVVHAGVHIADDVAIGADSVLYAGVIVYAGCVIGRRVIVHGGAVIGADGFGLAPEDGRWIKIPQVGRVVIGDDVDRLGIAGPGPEPVLPVEQGGIARQGEAELLEIGLRRPRHGTLRPVEGDAHLERGGVEIRARHAVDVPHLVAEGAPGLGLLRLGDQLQDVARSGTLVHLGEGADRRPRRGAAAGGEVVVLVQLGGEHDPEAGQGHYLHHLHLSC